MIVHVKFVSIPTTDRDRALAFYEELKARGEFDSPPQEQPWGTFAVIRDPDGNQLVLSSRA